MFVSAVIWQYSVSDKNVDMCETVSWLILPAMRFFCLRHAQPQSRLGRPPRKRVAEDLPDVVSKETIPQDVANTGPTPTKVSATIRSPKKTPGV